MNKRIVLQSLIATLIGVVLAMVFTVSLVYPLMVAVFIALIWYSTKQQCLEENKLLIMMATITLLLAFGTLLI